MAPVSVSEVMVTCEGSSWLARLAERKAAALMVELVR